MLPREFPKSRITLPAALAALAVLGTALWVRADPASPPFQGLDDAWLRLMGGPHDGFPWAVADGFDHGGGRLAAVGLLLFASVLTMMRRWRSALFAIAAFLTTYAATAVLKHLGDRPRPEDIMVAVSSPAFPSDHSSRVACLVVVIAVVAIPVAARRWWWPVGALLVLGMMWARTWQHAHWLTDTIGGVATGLGVSVLCWRVFDAVLRREREGREAGPGDEARTGEACTGVEDLSSESPPPIRQREAHVPRIPARSAAARGSASAARIFLSAAVYGHPYPLRPYNGMSIAALVVGIIGICNPIGILALIFGMTAKKQIRETGEQGEGFAVTGIIPGWIGVASVVFWGLYLLVIFSIWIPFVDRVTDPANWLTAEPSGFLT